MAIIIIVLIVISSLTNMVADVFLVSGKDHTIKNQPPTEIAKNTPDNHLHISGMLGLVSLSFWMGVLYFLSYLKGTGGMLAMLFYAAYIGCIMVFHVFCSNVFLLVKHSQIEEKKLESVFKFYMLMCVITSLLYTVTMFYLGLSGTLKMNIIHYLTLPFSSTVIVQFILGKIIKIKHFESIAGTFSMLVAMLSTIHIMVSNFNIL